jgi:hypothetical protein
MKFLTESVHSWGILAVIHKHNIYSSIIIYFNESDLLNNYCSPILTVLIFTCPTLKFTGLGLWISQVFLKTVFMLNLMDIATDSVQILNSSALYNAKLMISDHKTNRKRDTKLKFFIM